ncbi:helix-hairpin-helix domain-containing protein [Streptomyces caniferus]|uniref:helix-hairpin-helix domain-containing protein n=1 Tax=Streptomyces caniferus TaxID=285557 RepID=UPI0037100A5E
MAPAGGAERREWERERVRDRVAAIFGDAGAGAGAGAGAVAAAGGGPLPPGHDPPGPRRRERMWLAVRERLPLWVQLRCGTDPKALAALVLVLVLAVGFAVQHFWSGRPEPVRAPAAERSAAAADRAPRSPSLPSSSAAATAHGPPGGAGRQLVVDVTGKVRDPGIHRMPPGSRVIDALQAAGGVLRGASTSGLNRARLLTDGEQIVVGGAGAGGASGSGGAAGPAGAGAGGPGSGPPGAGGGPAGPVSLSTATEQQLDSLPGVGPVLARHIIEFRTQHGGFTSVDQLRQVTGIGDRRFADLRPLVQP